MFSVCFSVGCYFNNTLLYNGIFIVSVGWRLNYRIIIRIYCFLSVLFCTFAFSKKMEYGNNPI